MHSVNIAALAATELSGTLSHLSETQVDALLELICGAKRIFVAGAGRSMLMLRCFAMRLMHIGLTAYVVGDTTTPSFGAGDLLIIGSGSGETSGLVLMADKVKKLGGKLAVLSVFEHSTLGKKADAVIRIPAYTDKLPESAENKRPTLPGGSMFEQAMLVLGDTLILTLAEKTGISTDRMFALHANLE